MIAEKETNVTYPISDLIARRWSPRAFADRPIAAETMGSLLEAARWAPSSRNEQPWRFIVARRHDVGQAIAYLTLEAMRHDLYLRQMGGFYADRAVEILGIEPPYEPVTAIAVGYLGAPDILPDGLREREMGPRSNRHPLHEIAFTGRFGNSLDLG